jgi:peptidoglycan/xylan/chitin deacetylase (PgdA/CDA1 family)
VIASTGARSDIQVATSVPFSDQWWRAAQSSGLIDIGSHGWNHVHPAAREMRERPELVEAFDQIGTVEDAQQQIDASHDAIRAIAGDGAARLFAYPYGRVSDFIADTYLPKQVRYLGAVTTEPRPLDASCDPWRIPRYVCGRDWKTGDELEYLLTSA